MTARMTGTAWGRGLQNAAVVALGIIVVLGLSTTCLVLLFQQPFGLSLLISYFIFMVAVLLAFTFGWIYGRAQRGRVLHDCGPHPTRWLFLFNAVFFIFLGLNIGSDTFTTNFNLYRTGIAGFFLVFSLYWLVLSFGRLLICEHGLWQYWGLMPWHKVGYYEWRNDTLLIQSTARFTLLRKGALPVSPVDQPAVEELLQQYVSVVAEPPVEQPV